MKSPKLHSIRVLIIVPVFNEEGSLNKLIDQLSNLRLDKKYSIDLLFIDDGSTDSSKQILIENNLDYITHSTNLGLSATTQTGYKYAFLNDYDYMVKVDGDGQHPPSEIIKLLDAAEKYSEDLIIGSRFVKSTGYSSAFYRKVGITYASFLLRLSTGLKIKDTTSGFLVLKKDLLKFFSECSDYPQKSGGLIYLLIAWKAGFKFREVSIPHLQRKSGTSSINMINGLLFPGRTLINLLAVLIRNKE